MTYTKEILQGDPNYVRGNFYRVHHTFDLGRDLKPPEIFVTPLRTV